MDLQTAQWKLPMSAYNQSCQTIPAWNTLEAVFVESFPKNDYEDHSISVDSMTSNVHIPLSILFFILDTVLFFLTSNPDIGSAYS
jgi:hypothetical protein